MDDYNIFLQDFKANLPAIAQRTSWHHASVPPVPQLTVSNSAAAAPEPAYPTSPVQPLVLSALSPSPSQVHSAQVAEADAVDDSDFLLSSRLMTLVGASAVAVSEDPSVPPPETLCQAPPGLRRPPATPVGRLGALGPCTSYSCLG